MNRERRRDQTKARRGGGQHLQQPANAFNDAERAELMAAFGDAHEALKRVGLAAEAEVIHDVLHDMGPTGLISAADCLLGRVLQRSRRDTDLKPGDVPWFGAVERLKAVSVAWINRCACERCITERKRLAVVERLDAEVARRRMERTDA